MEGDSPERIAFHSHITPKSPVIPSASDTEASAKVASEESFYSILPFSSVLSCHSERFGHRSFSEGGQRGIFLFHSSILFGPILSFRALRTPKLQRRWPARNLFIPIFHSLRSYRVIPSASDSEASAKVASEESLYPILPFSSVLSRYSERFGQRSFNEGG
jgi:hypothetical protein